jgi:hypothetical protein
LTDLGEGRNAGRNLEQVDWYVVLVALFCPFKPSDRFGRVKKIEEGELVSVGGVLNLVVKVEWRPARSLIVLPAKTRQKNNRSTHKIEHPHNHNTKKTTATPY